MLCGSCGARVELDQQFCSCGRAVNRLVGDILEPELLSLQPGNVVIRRRANWIAFVVVALVTLILSVGATTWLYRGQERADLSTAPRVRITANASSVRSAMGSLTYLPDHAIDGNPATAWVEGVDGPGIGEWIRFDFDRYVEVLRMRLAPGYFKSSQSWARNNRLAMVTIDLSDGSSRAWSLDDRMEQQEFDLKGVRTRWVRITIERIYPGSQDSKDSPLSEVTFDFKPSDLVVN